MSPLCQPPNLNQHQPWMPTTSNIIIYFFKSFASGPTYSIFITLCIFFYAIHFPTFAIICGSMILLCKACVLTFYDQLLILKFHTTRPHPSNQDLHVTCLQFLYGLPFHVLISKMFYACLCDLT